MPWANDRCYIDRTVFELRFYDAAGNPHTYSTLGGYSDWEVAAVDRTFGHTGLQDTGAPIFVGEADKTNLRPTISLSKPDPRTFRFGVNAFLGDASSRVGTSMVPANLPGMPVSSSISCNSNYPGATTDPHYPGLLSLNVTAQGLYTQDRDGVTRPADGYLGASSFATTNPMRSGNAAARPVILNRPFRSVGELAYAFRDMPWKTLDFFSGESADALLLDVFCLEESEIVAGKIDINTRQPQTLEALLSGGWRNVPGKSAPLLPLEAAQIASALRNHTWGGATPLPYQNLTEVIRETLSKQTTSAAMPAIKTQREAAVRALASSAQTRTWNLLIDVVAQAGRYSINASRLKDFVVEGERRIWLQVAIDRLTGEVVDQQLEIVYE